MTNNGYARRQPLALHFNTTECRKTYERLPPLTYYRSLICGLNLPFIQKASNLTNPTFFGHATGVIFIFRTVYACTS